MTIKELLEVTSQIVEAEITIRNNGLYNYMYVYGEHIQIHRSYVSNKVCLQDGEIREFNTPDIRLPATFIAKDPRKAAKEILDLPITDLKISNHLNSWLYDNKGWTNYEAIITCDIGNAEFKGICVRKVEDKPKEEHDGQMNINDYLG